MESFEQTLALRHEYRYKAWLIVLMCLVAFCIGGSCFFVWWQAYVKTRSLVPGGLFAILPVFIAVYFLLMGLRSRIVLEGSRIDVRGAFTDKSADQSEVQGFRTISSRNGSYTQLILKEGRGTITISNSFSTDDAYRAWFQKVTDLDERDRQALLDEIAQQQDLGATPEERLAALSRAKTISIMLLAASVLLGIAIDFSFANLSLSTVRSCAVLLALAPLVSAWLVWRSPLLYAVMKKKKDPRAEVSFIPFIVGIAFMIYTSKDHFVTMQPLLIGMILIGFALVALFFNAARAGARGALIALVLFVGLFSYGVVAVADTLFDESPEAPFEAKVVGGHVSHGKSDTYYLRLAPWGPIDREQDVSVSRNTYENSPIGVPVCLVLHSGSLHAPWFRVVPCTGETTPAPAAQAQ
jgi:hypothetical protein